MRVGIGQINPHVGAIDANLGVILSRIDEARSAGCDLVVFPELAIPGYLPQDLLWRPGFVNACQDAAEEICRQSEHIAVVVGSIVATPSRASINRLDISSATDGAGQDFYNAALLFQEGRQVACVAKTHLPTFDIYNEKRYFTPSPGAETHQLGDVRIGINICEDIWVEDGPTGIQSNLGAEWILNLSASPFYVGKPAIRRRLLQKRASENSVGILYTNLVGGQDDVVFDGGSFIVNARGEFLFQSPRFVEGLFVADLDAKPIARPVDDSDEQMRRALVLGIRDYVRKNGFATVLVGLSGGVDSALVAALAVDALGPESVSAVYLPSRHSSRGSQEDAAAVASALGIEYLEISIASVHESYRRSIPDLCDVGLVDENLQPRIRGTLLMALSNARGDLVLCPGNKAEIAMGYNTLYGDTVGALAPIADLYKEDVYRLSRKYGDNIPPSILRKPPSAELRPDQRDEDDLPPYAVLDPILRSLIERNASRAELLAEGHAPELVDLILGKYYSNEYKRRQMPPGIKVTPKAFGTGRRIPITHAYRQ